MADDTPGDANGLLLPPRVCPCLEEEELLPMLLSLEGGLE